MRTAILVDGGFFLKRYRTLYKSGRTHSPEQVVNNLHKGLLKHLKQRHQSPELYRILFYDCPPLLMRVQNPVSKKGFSFKDTPEAQFRLGFHNELKRLRKVALRLGRLGKNAHWEILPDMAKQLLAGKIQLSDLQPKDVMRRDKKALI